MTEISSVADVITASNSLPDAPRRLARGLARQLFWVAVALSALLIACAIFAAAVPRATISPAMGLADIRNDSAITVDVPRLTSISRVEVTVNGVQRSLEYNIEGSSYTVPFQLDPGSDVMVSVKATSALGVIREFNTTFHTMEPMQLASASAAGQPLAENPAIAPQTPLDFSFDRPAERAWVTIDGSLPVPLEMSSDGRSASLAPTYVLKQGAAHTVETWAIGADGSALAAGNKYGFNVVAPLELKPLAANEGGESTITLDASVPFEDPALVEKTLQVSRPDLCEIKVESSKIILSVNQPLAEPLTLTVPSAFGADGSYLELPVQFSVQPAGGASNSASATAMAVTSGPGPQASSSASTMVGAQSDTPPPPPGWPPCCPWPPR